MHFFDQEANNAISLQEDELQGPEITLKRKLRGIIGKFNLSEEEIEESFENSFSKKGKDEGIKITVYVLLFLGNVRVGIFPF